MAARVGLIGDPVAHSRSPLLHNAAFAHYGISARYELWPTPAAELVARVESLRAPDVLGANVTLPHKVAVLPLLDRIDSQAARIGAVNTIVREADGVLAGYNTDAPAFIETLREDAGYEPTGLSVVLLGASGAARAAAVALLDAGAAGLTIVNRTLERAEHLLADLLASSDRDPFLRALAAASPDLADALADADLIVNATSLGWHDEVPIDPSLLPAGALVYDMVYRATPLLRAAVERGARTQDGLGMLVRQAALAFALWTHTAPPIEIMFAAADEFAS